MKFPAPLIEGHLIQRYKRFLADVRKKDGTIVTAHCPNTGSMRRCSTPGSEVRLLHSPSKTRKYPLTLEMVRDNTTWVGVNTARTNKLVIEGINRRQIPEFEEFDDLQPEVRVSSGSRLDLKVQHGDRTTYIEIKNCSLAEDGWAMFPDAKTARGTKHLHELMRLHKQGADACIFFLVQRMDAEKFRPAAHIDPHYAAALEQAVAAGVRLLVYQAEVTPEGIEIVRSLPWSLDRQLL